MEDFKIIECTAEKITVNRQPENIEEENMMRLAAQDAIMRKWLCDAKNIQFGA